jgi:phosphoribosyl 1,2-cyclic phosphodiesterase
MRVFVLGSGSTGNAVVVESGGTRVLLEAGVGPKVATRRLAELGRDLGPGSLDGIVPTHEHGDHFGHAVPLARAFGAPLFLHAGITAPSPREGGRRPPEPIDVRAYAIGTTLRIGALAITTVRVPHDATQVAIRIDDGACAFGLATDVGRITNELVELLASCDAVLVEANHCREMLASSEYPESVKRRVSGGLGHLSNDQTAELGARLVGSRVGRMWLGHLSESNNSPARALDVVATRARRIDVDVLPMMAPVGFDVRSSKPYQLGLPF